MWFLKIQLDLVLRLGEESNESVDLKKRKRSVDESSSNKSEKELPPPVVKVEIDDLLTEIKEEPESDHMLAVEADLQLKMANVRIILFCIHTIWSEKITWIRSTKSTLTNWQ